MIKAIETIYNGYKFRSRLEARWAAFFDLIGWRWEYEPTDFNGWIPDFALYGNDIIYVEVKPVAYWPQKVMNKIDRSGCKEEVLIVGQTNPIKKEDEWESPCIGWLRERADPYGPSGWWQKAPYGRWLGKDYNGNPELTVGFCAYYGIFQDRITGLYDGGGYGSGKFEQYEIDQIWAKSHNYTQWQPS